jgi:signal transduction histidine kinase
MRILHRDTPEYGRVMQYLKIVHNSSIHLENVIEDALDISRLENNKFSLVIMPESILVIMQEVMEVM